MTEFVVLDCYNKNIKTKGDFTNEYMQNRADDGIIDNQFKNNKFYNIYITKMTVNIFIYQGGKELRELTVFGYEYPAYNADLFLINYLGL